MKNPLEFTLLEVTALMRLHGPESPERELNLILRWLDERIREDHRYQVKKEHERIKALKTPQKADLSARAARSLDQDLLDSAEVVCTENEDD
jgi:hypothetical protein